MKGSRSKQTEEITGNVIPVLFDLKVVENKERALQLRQSIVTETGEVKDPLVLKKAAMECTPTPVSFSSLTPTKFLISFSSEEEVNTALEDNGDLWGIFDDVRRWTDGESFNERLVWIEYFNIFPKFWSLENIRRIGEQWGPVVRVDKNTENGCCLTHAKLLVRTKAQN